MKKIIKKSIDEIKICNSQKEEIYNKITMKKRVNFNFVYRYAFISLFILVSTLSVSKPNLENHNVMMARSSMINIENSVYTLTYMPYLIGQRLENITINNVTYEVYENELNENSLILYSGFYEVYLKIEE